MKFFVRKAAVLLLFAVCGCMTNAAMASELTVPPSTPIFEKPDFYSKLLAVSRDGGKFELLEEHPKRHFSVRHPIGWYNDYYKIRLPKGEVGYLSPEISCVLEPGNPPRMVSRFQQEWWRNVLSVLTICAFAFSLVVFWKKKREKSLQSGSVSEAGWMIAIAVTLRMVLMLYSSSLWGNAITSASDDPGYFATAMGFLHWDFTGPWNFTIGQGFFYIPFILLLNAKEFYDITLVFSYFSGLVLAPALLALGFWILRKLRFSNHSIFAAVLLWAVWPFFYYHNEIWDQSRFQSFFSWLSADNWWRYYSTLIGGGLNSMSDVPSSLVVFGCLLLLLVMPPKRSWVVGLALLFAFACLVRVNNVFFAPVLAYLAFRKFAEPLRKDWKYGIGLFFAAAIPFLALFSVQLWINHRHSGGFLVFPYVRHYLDWKGPRPSDGFTWEVFSRGVHIKFLAEANYAVWAMGLTGLLLMKDRARRTALALWIVPVIWFFFGYSHTFCDARRFVLSTYLPMFAAFTGLEVWRNLPLRKMLLLSGGIVLSMLFVTPSDYAGTMMPFLLPPGAVWGILRVVLPLGMALLTFWFWRTREREAALLAGVFTLIFFALHAYGFAALLMFALLRALYDWTREWMTLYRAEKSKHWSKNRNR